MVATGIGGVCVHGGGGGGEEMWNEIGCAKDQIFLKGCRQRVQWRGQV